MPAASGEDVVMVKAGGAIVIVKLPVSVAPSLSVTRTTKLKLPTREGVPVMLPDELSESPLGREPEAIEKVYGSAPFWALTVPE